MTTTTFIDPESARKFGIDFLTGEACALSMRMLCEVTEDMMQTILDYNGLHVDVATLPHSEWNNRNKYSVFLTWEAIEDLIIMKLVDQDGYVVECLPNEDECNKAGAWGKKHLLSGNSAEVITEIEEHPNLYSIDNKGSLYKIGRQYWTSDGQPRRGFSNIHAFSGMSQ
jgi:hypothetical protein